MAHGDTHDSNESDSVKRWRDARAAAVAALVIAAAAAAAYVWWSSATSDAGSAKGGAEGGGLRAGGYQHSMDFRELDQHFQTDFSAVGGIPGTS